MLAYYSYLYSNNNLLLSMMKHMFQVYNNYKEIALTLANSRDRSTDFNKYFFYLHIKVRHL